MLRIWAKHGKSFRLCSCVLLVCILNAYHLTSLSVSFALAAVGFIATGNRTWYWICLKTLPRDIWFLSGVVRFMVFLKRSLKQKMTVVDFFENAASRFPQKIAVISADTGDKMTFYEMNVYTVKIANMFSSLGYHENDSIAIFMENRIEYLPIWIGLSRIGVISSLINSNLRDESLCHCISVGCCKALIYSYDLRSMVDDVRHKLPADMRYFCIDRTGLTKDDPENLSAVLDTVPPSPMSKPAQSLMDKLMFIYTSGTTGLPKAAVIKGVRYLGIAKIMSIMYRITSEDVAYTALPLYHSSAGIIIAGQLLLNGCTLVVRKKFSASKFFEDCSVHNVTVSNYIGEVCRYLLAQPPRHYDRNHKVRVLIGNGLRASIWQEFQDRFAVPLIGEFYGSTEGNANVCNTVGKVGAVGFNSVAFAAVSPLKIVKVDRVTNAVLRDDNGLAILCEPKEVGELIAKIDPRFKDMLPFEGYVNKAATEKKIIHDVLQHGDSAFRTGDLLYQDNEGYLYFHDRFGDTFRWKGENVSTNEVEGIISRFLNLQDVVCYGVSIPGTDGKAGMICIADPTNSFNIENLRLEFCPSLPAYAQPVFIRVARSVDTTGTFKLKKSKLQGEGFDPSMCGTDALYYRQHRTGKTELLTVNVYQDILVGRITF